MDDVSQSCPNCERLAREVERLRSQLPECQLCATIYSSDGWYCSECAPGVELTHGERQWLFDAVFHDAPEREEDLTARRRLLTKLRGGEE